jgi:hypothetical protein
MLLLPMLLIRGLVKKTRSLLVIYKDKIIAEKYETGFTKESKLLGGL